MPVQGAGIEAGRLTQKKFIAYNGAVGVAASANQSLQALALIP